MPLLSHDKKSSPSSKALDAVTPILLFTTGTTLSRVGYTVFNNAAPGGANIYVLELPAGTSAPTFADMVTNGKATYMGQPGQTIESGARVTIDVWACVSAGTLTVYPQEAF